MRTLFCLLFAVPMLGGAVASAASERAFDQTVAAQPRGVVDISNVSGTIEVNGWDRAEVRVHADVDDEVQQVEVSSDAGHTRIKVVLPHNGHGGDAHLTVQIPKDSELDVSAVSADVTTRGVQGMQRLSAVSGEVNAELGGSDLELKTVSGDVRLKGHGQPARLHLSTVSGDVHLEHGAGDLEAGSVSGTLVLSLDSARSVLAHTTSGDVRFHGHLTRGATLEATTVSGDLEVRAGADGGFGYEVRTFSGDISDCFEAQPERSAKYMPGSRLEGTRGEGAGHVRLKTMSGGIQLCDRN